VRKIRRGAQSTTAISFGSPDDLANVESSIINRRSPIADA
jgi:hypothetical protein